MTDDEVRRYLDLVEGEDMGFDHAIQDDRPGDVNVYRRLAIARKCLKEATQTIRGLQYSLAMAEESEELLRTMVEND